MTDPEKTKKIEVGRYSNKLPNVVNNADARNVEKISEDFFIFIDEYLYKVHESKLNIFQKQKLDLYTREKKSISSQDKLSKAS